MATIENINTKIIRYEDLCLNPTQKFRQLFDWANLQFGAPVEENIHATTHGASDLVKRNETYGTTRDSRLMMDAWKIGCTIEEAREMQQLYLSSSLTNYRDSKYWVAENNYCFYGYCR